MTQDPVQSNPDHYKVVFENERVRVLEYRDTPGHISKPHRHPDSVMLTASPFHRRLHTSGGPDGPGGPGPGGPTPGGPGPGGPGGPTPAPGGGMDVELPAGAVRWLPAQEHYGENTGETETHVFFVELKEPNPSGAAPGGPGPAGP
ncbi:cytoplasmic protein [Arthrobacter sp. zg-Y1110]|uniref:cytoplasmic protein n=1 Tax=Arthrobacter sp. zg-Y1110 TaxID=2886932 RepID=UPI001D142093|nr:cytoplasmic protein [Arthrobacter sp. zg-Y1110]MCC3291830.1 cytoplasmic protein [Arthrobacter sp. zg-Y1110]UWX85659.1 cytoplasmic protein [Arthrobacter sp. zg-Y1110]